MLGANLGVDPAPGGGGERVQLAADGDVLMVEHPELLAFGVVEAGALVDVGQSDLVGGLGVEPVADQVPGVVVMQAAQPGPRSRVSGRWCGGGHGPSSESMEGRRRPAAVLV